MESFVAVRGLESSDASPVLSWYADAGAARPWQVNSPVGEDWTGDVAVRGETIVAATADFDGGSRVHVMRAEPGAEPVEVWRIDQGRVSAVSLSPDGETMAVAVDVGTVRLAEQIHLVRIDEPGACPSIVPMRPSTSHVFSMTLCSADRLMLARVGTARGPQHREVAGYTVSGALSGPTPLLQDHVPGVFQILGAALSPDGTRLAAAHSDDEGATFCVSLVSVGTGARRLLLKREHRLADPAWADLAFDRAGERLLVGYGQLGWVSVVDAEFGSLLDEDEGTWVRAAWG
ncbi:hypothetical protein HII36_55405 [Nonomuraea sp. NN258]|uniref:hypothetical protein n=1 Tax=Nonomuraea antri TaxID=2730852 RepID=UPI00156A2819|nr:hypothetical protein [Nonomuraea antri]NRQ40934.1 hypothetical protein [Nonomuraea antri]